MINLKAYSTWLHSTKHVIWPESKEKTVNLTLKEAAVSIILVENNIGGYSIVFGQRSNDVPQHKGQIAFPGGGLHKNETLFEAAIRETQEETGLIIDVNNTDSWNFLGEYPKKFITISDYLITPYIFIYKPFRNGFTSEKAKKSLYIPDGREMVDVFDVPLTHLLDPANVQLQRREWQGRIFDIHYYTYNDKTIWGVTGMLLYDFLLNLEPFIEKSLSKS